MNIEIKCNRCAHKEVCERKTCFECKGGNCDKCKLLELYGRPFDIDDCGSFKDESAIKNTSLYKQLHKKLQYNNEGPCLTVSTTFQLKYENYEVFEFPVSCTSCPVGFCSTSCGRNVPFKKEDYRSRPETCKLKKVSIEEAVAKLLEEFKNADSLNKNKT